MMYTKTVWRNDQTPAINETNLNKIEDQLELLSNGDQVVYNNTDTTINLAITDLNKVLLIDNAANVIINLPSVAASNIGIWLEVKKLSTGNITINAADSDILEDSSAGGSIANTALVEVGAFIKIRLHTATSYGIAGILGTWPTT